MQLFSKTTCYATLNLIEKGCNHKLEKRGEKGEKKYWEGTFNFFNNSRIDHLIKIDWF